MNMLRILKCTVMAGLLIAALFVPVAARAEDVKEAPVKIQAALFLQLLPFHKGLATAGDVTICVVGAPEFAKEMKKAVGKPFGKTKSKIKAVVEEKGLPTTKPSVLYVGDAAKVDEITKYTRKNKVLSIAGKPALVTKGVTLAVGALEGKPKVLLNISASKEEGVDWNPAILKIAQAVK